MMTKLIPIQSPYICNNVKETIASEKTWAKAHRRCQRIGTAIESIKGEEKTRTHHGTAEGTVERRLAASTQGKNEEAAQRDRGMCEGTTGRPVGKRSRFLTWAVSVGADVCPFYHAACTALRIEQRIITRKQGDHQQWAPARDPLDWILKTWAWQRGPPKGK